MDFDSDFAGMFNLGEEPVSFGDLYKDHVFSDEFIDFALMDGMMPPVEMGASELFMPDMDISEMFAKEVPNFVSLSSSPLQQSQGPSPPSATAGCSRRLHNFDGSSNSPIDVETLEDDDDDVQILSSPSFPPQAKTRRRVMDPAVVVLDEVSRAPLNESGWAISGESSVTKLSSEAQKKQSIPFTGISVSHVAPLSTENDHSVKMGNMEELSVLPKEPTFNCPICLSPFSEACSTNCGHIFCHACIKASIKAQKKCPTCRKKLTMRSFHRVYLPSSD